MKPSWQLLLLAVIWGVVSYVQGLIPGWPAWVILPLGLAVAYLINEIIAASEPDKGFTWNWLWSSVVMVIVAGLLSLFGANPLVAFLLAFAVPFFLGWAVEREGIWYLAPVFLIGAVFLLTRVVSGTPNYYLVPAAYLLAILAIAGLQAWYPGHAQEKAKA